MRHTLARESAAMEWLGDEFDAAAFDLDEANRAVQSVRTQSNILETPSKAMPLRRAPQPGRNEPCPCGSAKKYKKCCGRS